MAGSTVDPIFGAAVATPGNGLPKRATVDRDGNEYANNYYMYDTNNTRRDLRTVIDVASEKAITYYTTATGAATSATLAGTHVLNRAGGVVTLTLPTPVAADFGKRVVILNNQAQLNVVTFTGACLNLGLAAGAYTTATVNNGGAGYVGANLHLIVIGLGYYLENNVLADTDVQWNFA